MKNYNNIQSLRNFYSLKIDSLTNQYVHWSPEKLQNDGFKSALNLFKAAAEHVPAYKAFLKENNIDPKKIKHYSDFQKVPIINKHNYLRKYSLKDLCWNGQLKDRYIISSSSGSTGTPFMWPRGEEQELEGAITHELIFKNIFELDKKSTLYINCFSQGVWVAGHFSLACVEYLSKKGYPISTINPGLDTNITIMLIKTLAPEFDQIILSGYPPLIKDLMDLGKQHGINWQDYNIRFLFAAEGFSEKWREHMHTMVKKTNHVLTSINIYGSADAGALAHETPLSIAIRRSISSDYHLLQAVFNENRIPTLAQYDPRNKFMEMEDNSIIFTANAGIPLIRYAIGDQGGILTYNELKTKLNDLHINFEEITSNLGKQFDWKLPFVYVFGRSDFTVSFYGLLIYPEHIKYGLEKKTFEKYITGKFVMSVDFNENQNPQLLIRVELAEGINGTKNLQHKLSESIRNGLKKVNCEYNKLYQTYKDKVDPIIELVENGNPEYFKKGIKQKWVKK